MESHLQANKSKRPWAPILAKTEQRLGDSFTPNQVLGRLATIGCVAVEITQKCNLDCTLCYLSEHSQSVADIPLEEVFRRLDAVIEHYGRGTHVQITGGDPTLRKHSELVQIVQYASDLGLHTALFTNGIGATRKLLAKLAKAGLRDVAFHVDSTQRRPQGDDESALNGVRLEYIERAKGLGLMVAFNTTVHKDNFLQVPELVSFFRQHADAVGLVSFQLQADTGRGEWRKRAALINQASVCQQIELGAQRRLPWDVVQVGHSDCHYYLPTLVVNDRVYPLIEDKQLFAEFLNDFAHLNWSRGASRTSLIMTFLQAIAIRPRWWYRIIRHGVGLVRRMTKDLVMARGKAHKMTFFVQNFMDAQQLVSERVKACSFMVMTASGPVSMCEHNAKRDEYILQPLEITRADGSQLSYRPLQKSKAGAAAISDNQK